MFRRCLAVEIGFMLMAVPFAHAQQPDTSRGDAMIRAYFRGETEKIAEACLADIRTKEDWEARRGEYRRQLLEMLGLDPLPERTPLKAETTGTTEHEEFVVEKVHFQSRPGLYVTGNLYLPKRREGRLPAILYVCGHGRVTKDGVSFGNKVHYRHHGGWFARNGYVCLTIDTLQLGEIEGVHHGTYGEQRDGQWRQMWWWNCRGYTPAGVEAWNCVRALDYLQTRAEVDGERIGVTGRSGGGAYSWWIAAIDDRIKCAVPVAGITDLENHVVQAMPGDFHDGCVEGHCDCMYMLNTYRWDYAQVATLVAPRPLLISNTDKDAIFPLEGVVRLHEKVRRVYRLLDADANLGLQITEGGHNDTQELHIHAFQWFNKHLKGETTPIRTLAEPFFEPEQLKVFDELPSDEVNTRIHYSFVPRAEAKVPENGEDWIAMKGRMMEALKAKVFRGWPDQALKLGAEGWRLETGETEVDRAPGSAHLELFSVLDLTQVFSVTRFGVEFSAYDFTCQENICLRLYVAHREGLKDLDLLVLNVLDDQGWREFLSTYRAAFAEQFKDEQELETNEEGFKALSNPDDEKKPGMLQTFPWAMAYVAPRGVGPTAWDQSERKQTQHQRRFMLLGQTLDGMRVYDAVRAAAAARAVDGLKFEQLWLHGERQAAGIAIYASLFIPDVYRIDLHDLPSTHEQGPYFLNVMRFFDVPQAVALAAENSRVVLYQAEDDSWDFPKQTAENLGWDERRIRVRTTR